MWRGHKAVTFWETAQFTLLSRYRCHRGRLFTRFLPHHPRALCFEFDSKNPENSAFYAIEKGRGDLNEIRICCRMRINRGNSGELWAYRAFLDASDDLAHIDLDLRSKFGVILGVTRSPLRGDKLGVQILTPLDSFFEEAKTFLHSGFSTEIVCKFWNAMFLAEKLGRRDFEPACSI